MPDFHEDPITDFEAHRIEKKAAELLDRVADTILVKARGHFPLDVLDNTDHKNHSHAKEILSIVYLAIREETANVKNQKN